MRKISKAGSENRTAIESCTVLFLCHGCFSDHCDKTYGSLSEFQSTLPVRGATGNGNLISETDKFQSTLPMRGATCVERAGRTVVAISIHAPHEESDHLHNAAL